MTSNNERQEYLDMFYESTLTENEINDYLYQNKCGKDKDEDFDIEIQIINKKNDKIKV